MFVKQHFCKLLNSTDVISNYLQTKKKTVPQTGIFVSLKYRRFKLIAYCTELLKIQGTTILLLHVSG